MQEIFYLEKASPLYSHQGAQTYSEQNSVIFITKAEQTVIPLLTRFATHYSDILMLFGAEEAPTCDWIFSLALGNTFELLTLPLFYWFCNELPLTCYRPLTRLPFCSSLPSPMTFEEMLKSCNFLGLHCLRSPHPRGWRRQRKRCPLPQLSGGAEKTGISLQGSAAENYLVA